MNDFANQRILVGVSGGIAAYKSAHLVRELKKRGAQVKVAMTATATQFVAPLTFQALSGLPALTDIQESNTDGMEHISVARWAEQYIIVPATANIIAKMAHGIADNILSTLYLATRAPVIVCPAMNHVMWHHEAMQANIALLKARQVRIIYPEEGQAACGETGVGRLCEIEHLIQYLRLPFPLPDMTHINCIITAGPTKERIDPVRYLTNDSSGKMGYALAYAAQLCGANVTLVTGPTSLTPPPNIKVIQVVTATEMNQAVLNHLTKDCLFIGAAAVADYSLGHVAKHKIKKDNHCALNLSLERTPDILSNVVNSKLARFVVGFAAETQDVLSKAKDKLHKKKVDLIVANQVGNGQGFDREDNTVTLLTSQREIALPPQHKTRLAAEIMNVISMLMSTS